MLVNMNDVLYPAKKGKYAVGLFNAVNLELARGIIAAAENSQSPVIMELRKYFFHTDHWKRFPIILFLWLRKQMFR
ncbi:MAG: class II fructose-bisphosphate aldolase [Dorea formicigenerans]